jgi:hypothetical protein
LDFLHCEHEAIRIAECIISTLATV